MAPEVRTGCLPFQTSSPQMGESRTLALSKTTKDRAASVVIVPKNVKGAPYAARLFRAGSVRLYLAHAFP